MRFPDPQFVQSGDVRLACYAAGNPDHPAILLIHGWPELAYSWLHIIGPLVEAGYHVIAPDLRGFGRSDCPKPIEAYRIDRFMDDIEATLDHFGHERAVLCGHDWGGIIVWHAARLIAPRVSKVISICTPHIRRAPVNPVEIFRKRYGDEHYFVHFNDRPGVADALFARDIDGFFRLMFRTVPKGTQVQAEFTYIPSKFERFLKAGSPELKGQILSPEHRAVFVDGYKRSGFSGGINLYRNTHANWLYMDGHSEMISQPTLMLSPEDDLLLPPALTEPMVDMIADLTRVTIADCGHWAMWEQPKVISDAIRGWL